MIVLKQIYSWIYFDPQLKISLIKGGGDCFQLGRPNTVPFLVREHCMPHSVSFLRKREKLILTSFGCFPPGGCGPGGSGPGGSGPGGSGPGGSGPGGGGSGGSWANTRPTPRITASEKRLFILGISSLLQQSHGKLLRYLITQYTSYKYSKNDGVDQ